MAHAANVLRPPTGVGAKTSGVLADRSTPLLREEWYVAALAGEISRVPMRRTICEQDIVFYRSDDNTVVALQNRCAHRSYPLSNGKLSGNRIVCGYHGMEFGPDGRCAHIPAQSVIPGALRVQAYPVIEQGPFIWVWTGNPDAPDMSKFLEQPWFTEPAWASVHGYMYMQASYLGLHENLLDLSHFSFVHGTALARPEHAKAELRTELRAGNVHGEVTHEDVEISPIFENATGFKRPVTRAISHDVPTPAVNLGQAILTDSSDPPRTMHRYIVHYPTPETRFTTHYFWGLARNAGIDSPALQAETQAFGDKAFEEDKVVLEEIERLVARDHRPEFREKIIGSDKGGIMLLRWLADRQRAEERRSNVQQS